MAGEFKVNVRITDTEQMQSFINEYKTILEDERIDKHIREEYYERFEKIFNEIFKKKEKKIWSY